MSGPLSSNDLADADRSGHKIAAAGITQQKRVSAAIRHAFGEQQRLRPQIRDVEDRDVAVGVKTMITAISLCRNPETAITPADNTFHRWSAPRGGRQIVYAKTCCGW